MFQPVGDDRPILVQLDFDDAERAGAFLHFLETRVWSSPEAAPALDGTPRALVLAGVDTSSG